MTNEQAALTAAQQLAEAGARSVRGPVRSVILHGSLTLADFVPGRSDIDLLMVVDRPATRRESDALVAVVGSADLGGAGGIDLHVVTAEVAAAPTPTPGLNLHVGRYPGKPLEFEANAESAVDLLAELSMARADGRRLIGSEPREVLSPVPPEWIRARGVHWLRTWLTLTGDTEFAAFMVLTACRIWRFAIDEVHSSKTAAGQWALARDRSLTAIDQALAQRRGDPATPVDEAGIREVLDRVLGEVGGPDEQAPHGQQR